MTPRLAVAPRRRDDVDLERDRVLVERCQAGDASAFDDLYLRYYSRLCRFCFRRLGDIAEAEDTAQEAFARAWKAMPNFNGERRFYPWLSVIASHLCVDSIRRNTRTTPVGEEELDLVVRPVDAIQELVVEQQDDRDLLVKAMGRISPRHREVLQLREGYEWSYQKIAEHQGVQVSTIETLLFRARRSLRREFLILAEGQAGLAGFLLVLRKLAWKARVRLVPLGSNSLSSSAAPAAGTLAGASAVPAAAGFLATAMAAGAVAVVASLAPHPALAAGAITTPRSVPAASARALLPIASAHPAAVGASVTHKVAHPATHRSSGGGHPARGSTGGSSVGGATPGGSSAAGGKSTGSTGSTGSTLQTGGIAGPGSSGVKKVVTVLHHVTTTVTGILTNPTKALGKTVSKVVGTVHKVLKTVTKTVNGLLGTQNPLSGLLNGLGGLGSTGSTGNTGSTGTGATGNSGGLLGGLGL